MYTKYLIIIGKAHVSYNKSGVMCVIEIINTLNQYPSKRDHHEHIRPAEQPRYDVGPLLYFRYDIVANFRKSSRLLECYVVMMCQCNVDIKHIVHILECKAYI